MNLAAQADPHLLTRVDLLVLLEARDGWRVSLFTPTIPSDNNGNVIRIKNLLREAEDKLLALGAKPEQARKLLQPARQFAADGDWWRVPAQGLALFVSETEALNYHLPYAPPPLAVVGHRFHVKPLLPMFTSDGHFHVLALSQNEVRLLRGTRMGVTETELTNVPQSLSELLASTETQEQVRWHAGPAGGRRGRLAIFHGGHGVATEDRKDDIREYFRQIDRGLRELLRQHNAPLVLAGVDYLLPLYREVNNYPHLMEGGVTGNPEELSLEDLHRAAWPLVQGMFQQEQRHAREQYELAAGKGQGIHRIEEAVPAAHAGRVATLFVPIEKQLWGTYEPEIGEVTLHEKPQPEDVDLIDCAAVEALGHGGQVFAVPAEDLPAEPVAGVLRY